MRYWPIYAGYGDVIVEGLVVCCGEGWGGGEAAVRRRGVSPCRSPVVESELNKTQHNAPGSYPNKLLWSADTVTVFSQANKTSRFRWLSYYSLLPCSMSEECRKSAFWVDAYYAYFLHLLINNETDLVLIFGILCVSALTYKILNL